MVVVKLGGRVNYVNPAFTDMFGWTLDGLAGKHTAYVPPNLVVETGKGIKKPTWDIMVYYFQSPFDSIH
ncbi:MAG: PAS domain S-box protein, partial [Deltaproteobacteria bacterium]|nr:PAS domain S-box protein [Deltaproteobacteria bacterium]